MKKSYQCTQCKDSFPEDEMRFTESNQDVCITCYIKDQEKELFICEECEDQYHQTERADCDYSNLCRECFQEHILTLER